MRAVSSLCVTLLLAGCQAAPTPAHTVSLAPPDAVGVRSASQVIDRKSTRLNSSH